MEKVDARKLPRTALKEMRRLAMRMREELRVASFKVRQIYANLHSR